MGARSNDDRASREAELFPDTVLEIALDGKVQLAAVGEGDECRRGNGCLGQIIDPQRAAALAGQPAQIESLQEGVHLGRGNADIPGSSYLGDQAPQAGKALALQRRNKGNGRSEERRV